jgi:hypothetical protein
VHCTHTHTHTHNTNNEQKSECIIWKTDSNEWGIIAVILGHVSIPNTARCFLLPKYIYIYIHTHKSITSNLETIVWLWYSSYVKQYKANNWIRRIFHKLTITYFPNALSLNWTLMNLVCVHRFHKSLIFVKYCMQ